MPDAFWTGLFGVIGIIVTGVVSVRLAKINQKLNQQSLQLVRVVQVADAAMTTADVAQRVAEKAKSRTFVIEDKQVQLNEAIRTNTFELEQLKKAASEFGKLD